jgi:purine-binding chemotaxis protein CheW
MAWLQAVVFRIGNEEFALDISCCQRVIAGGRVAALPEAPDWVAGVLALPRKVLPVLDLRGKLSGAAAEAAAKCHPLSVAHCLYSAHFILVVKAAKGDTYLGEEEIGLVVDQASEVAKFQPEQVEPVPDYIVEIGADYIAGIIRLGARAVPLLDLEKLFSRLSEGRLEELVQLLGRAKCDRLPPGCDT